METPSWYVLTGGPCVGKTTLLHELAKRGYTTVSEVARTVIEEGLAQKKTLAEIRSDEGAFQRTVLERKCAVEEMMPRNTVTFFDRAIPDSVAYYRANNIAIDDELQRAVEHVAYKKIFLLAPLPMIQDDVRNETPEKAALIQQLLGESYRELGFEVIDVPVSSTTERADFILTHL